MTKPAILNTLQQWVAVPEGPTEEMAERGGLACVYSGEDGRNGVNRANAYEAYTAMLAARPSPNALQDVVAYVAELEARLKEAEKVIEPFAQKLAEIEPNAFDVQNLLARPVSGMRDDELALLIVAIGQLRAARAFMEGKS